MSVRSWRGAASLLVYTALAAVIGRQVLAHLGTQVANDPGDPLLTAAILHWNATTVPWTDAWYQLPLFFPASDTLTFSEHLLGLSVVATPLHWLIGNPLATYNLTMLLTFVLSAGAMYALTWYLTRSAAAAFVAGLAFGFAPYRVSQLPHVQMLAAFYAPLALLGLHAFIDTGRRRWLLLYAAAWTLQAAANGYMLVFFSVLVGLWVAWFVIARRKWMELLLIGVSTVAAVLPLVPILLRYVRVHQFHGFVRSVDEIRYFSADIAGVLCAPPALTFWGWLRSACRPEGELFPGTALAVVCAFAAARALGWRSGVRVAPGRVVQILSVLLVAAAIVYLAIAASVGWLGPWRMALGPLRASASSTGRPLVIGALCVLCAVLIRPGPRRAVAQSSTMAFYLFAGVFAWVLALGPEPRFQGMPVGYQGPFAWLMQLPGGDSLRVPARFWLVSTVCLAVTAGLFAAMLLRGKGRRATAAVLTVLSLALVGDGWTMIPSVAPRPAPPDPPALAGRRVLELPIDDGVDIAAEYYAVTGGWISVNGYSGFVPQHYLVLREGIADAADAVFEPLQARGDLAVIVPNDAGDDQRFLRRQPGVSVTGKDATRTQFLLPARPRRSRAGSVRAAIQSIASPCDSTSVAKALDRDPATQWVCGPVNDAQRITIDLGRVQSAGAVMHGSATGIADYPRQLRIETSIDGVSWAEAWAGDTRGRAFDAAIADPRTFRLWLPFAPRDARYVRLTHPGQDKDYTWSLAEVEVWTR